MWSGARRGRPPGRRPDPFVVLLVVQLVQKIYELPWKPPVTILVMTVNALIHFKSELLPYEVAALIPSIREGCLKPQAIVMYGEWWRLIWSAFLHLDDTHLYYNMTSLLIKGVQLERQLGSMRFAGLLAELLLVSHGVMAVVCTWLSESFHEHRPLGVTCAAGFSAVLFALKYVLTHDQPGWAYPMGIGVAVPAKYISWAELLLIHYLVPGSSFTGHLAGICAGMIHVHLISPSGSRMWRILRAIRRVLMTGWRGSWNGTGTGHTTSGRTRNPYAVDHPAAPTARHQHHAQQRALTYDTADAYATTSRARGTAGQSSSGSGWETGWAAAAPPTPQPAVAAQPSAPPVPGLCNQAPVPPPAVQVQPSAPPLPAATAAAAAAERRLLSAAAADARLTAGVQRGTRNLK